MRKFRRWVSTAAMLLLAWVAVTGFVLALDLMYPPASLRLRDESGDAPGSAAIPQASALDTSDAPLAAADLAAMAATSLHAALANRQASINSVELQLRTQDGAARGTVNIAGAADQTYSVDATSGKVLEITSRSTFASRRATPWYDDVPLRLRWHNLLQDLHRGSIIGISGQVMDILTGLSFITLSVTGILMYFEMLGRRKQIGRKAWFWK